MKQEFLTPVGRLVQGDPFEAQTKNMQGQPLMTQSGQPTQRYFIAVAFPKMVNGQPNAEFAALWQKLEATGRAGFPGINIAPPWDPACRFSWKVMDGDGVDDNGKPNANKEGFAGHWVVKFSSSFAPRCFHAGHYQPHEQIQDPKLIKRGYFVRVAGTVEGNGNAQKPGIYVNLSMVELAGQGPEIVSGPDAASIFGGNPVAQLPAGATPLPMHAAAGGLPGGLPPGGAPAGMVAPGQSLPGQMPGAALPGALPGMQPQQGVMPGQPVQQMAVQPHPGILGNGLPGSGAGYPAGAAQGGLPTAGAMPGGLPMGGAGVASGATMSPSNGLPGMQPLMMQPQQPAAPQLTPQGAATGMTYQQMLAQGYTEAQLRGGGYIV
jgi:hypothetical protein